MISSIPKDMDGTCLDDKFKIEQESSQKSIINQM